MRKAIVVLALVILVLTFLGSEVSSGRSTTKPANVHAKKSGDNPKEHPIEHPKEHKTEPHSKEHKTEPSKEHSKEHHSKEPHSKEHKTEPSKEHSKEHHSKEHHSKEHPKEHPKEHHSKEHTKTPEEKCRHVVVGPSKDAFKKNLPQDFCAIFNKGGKKAGQLKQADGSQILTGVCSNTPQGEIPKVEHMPSTLIIFPDDGKKIKRNKPFKVQVKTDKLELGFFSDPEINYNSFPQVLNKKGLIQGHQHVTIQYLGKNKKSMKTPDATKFSFFKGLNDPAKNGLLAVEVDKGLPEKGIYRICTIISSFSHQPIVLPKAQRGASDDCVRITVV